MAEKPDHRGESRNRFRLIRSGGGGGWVGRKTCEVGDAGVRVAHNRSYTGDQQHRDIEGGDVADPLSINRAILSARRSIILR